MKYFIAFVAALLTMVTLTACIPEGTSADDGSEITSSVRIPWVCHHEEKVKMFSFQFENSTAMSHSKTFCKNCNQSFGHSTFRDTPSDPSYLEAVKEYIVEDDIFAGEYYTMSATVALRDYDVDSTRIRCQVQRDDIVVNFSVEFREEFGELVSTIQVGEEITFRGRLYNDGFGWMDCELIEK